MKNSGKKPVESAKGAARLVLGRGLWWVCGFPGADGKSWNVLPVWKRGPIESLSLTEKDIRNGVYALKELQYKFPRAFPLIVPDAKVWVGAVERILDTFRAFVHEGKALPATPPGFMDALPGTLRAQAKELRGAGLGDLLDAGAWSYITEPSKFQRFLNWMDLEQETLRACLKVELPLGRIFFIFELTGRHPVRLTRHLLELLSLKGVSLDQEIHAVQQIIQGLRDWLENGHEPVFSYPEPSTDFRSQFLDWLDDIASDSPAGERAALRFFEATVPREIMHDWRNWWQKVQELYQPLRNIAKAPHLYKKEIEDILASLTYFINRHPMPLNVAFYFDGLRKLTANVNHRRRMPETLRMFPEERQRIYFMLEWSKSYNRNNSPAVFMLYYKAFHGYLRRNRKNLKKALRFWDEYFPDKASQYGYPQPDTGLYMEGNSWDSFYRVLEKIPENESTQAEELMEAIEELLNVGVLEDKIPGLAVELCRSLSSDSCWDGKDFRLAQALAGSQGESLIPVLQAILDAPNGSRSGERVVIEFLLSCGLGDMARFLITKGLWRDMERCGVLLEFTNQEGLLESFFKGQIGETPAWIKAYPLQLEQALLYLSRVSQDARGVAENILATDFPQKEKLEQEIRYLRDSMEGVAPESQEKLKNRLEKQERRLRDVPQLSPRRLDNLREKLMETAHRRLLAVLESELKSRNDEKLLLELESEDLPEWLEGSENRNLLNGLLELPAPFRDMGLEILHKRVEPGPWDLREHPANADFIRKLEARGFKMKPWLDGVGVQEYVGPEESILYLSLEEDPLQIFQMGAYFSTCLSPGDFNFYSTVSNAADINKRVVYGRDEKGRVQGRCLLALTDMGGILTFRSYSNIQGEYFEKALEQFIKSLGQAMETNPVPGGEVSSLVTSKWYDDGVEDVTRSFNFLEHKSHFRVYLRAMSLESYSKYQKEIFDELRKSMGQKYLEDHGDLVLSSIFNLPELQDNASLMGELRHELKKQAHNLNYAALDKLIRILAAEGWKADALFFYHIYAARVEENWNAPELLFLISPDIYLKSYRRISRIHKNDGLFFGYLFWQGRALETQSRFRKAGIVYKRIIQRCKNEYYVEDADRRLKALED